MARKTRPRKNGYRGLQGGVRSLKLPRVSVWENRYPDRDITVSMDIPEFTCVCPKTGLPDFAVLRLSYVPDRHCLELKSLKGYINAFRDLGVFHEHVVNRILDDLWASCRPRAMFLEGSFNPRGGIRTTVTASRGDLQRLEPPPFKPSA